MKPADSDLRRKLRRSLSSRRNFAFRFIAAIGMGVFGLVVVLNLSKTANLEGAFEVFASLLGFCSCALYGHSCATLNLFQGAALIEHGTIYRYSLGGNIGKAVLLTAVLASGTLLAFIVKNSPLFGMAAIAALATQLVPLVMTLTGKVQGSLVSELRFLQTNRMRGRTYYLFETAAERFAVRSDLLVGDAGVVAALVTVD